ncbi:restriction endonuclease subunit S [Nodosilinea sp. PGN35]|uniref:restriction endonuclease subunit S n=1 Tax=Nodosilinea sp. PGN35 TaxID=3020489 RepID=UPI00398AC990
MKPGFQETKIGSFSSDWLVVPIGKVTTLSQYGLSISADKDGTVPILGMKNLSNGKINLNNLSCVSISDKDKENFCLKKNDVLLNRTNSYDLVGKVSIYESEEVVVFASYLVRFQFDQEKIVPKFANYFLNSYIAQSYLKKIATKGVSQVNINPTVFKKLFLIPVPSLQEQKQIVEVLEAWDSAIALTEQLITAKQKLKRGLMQQIFSGKPNLSNGMKEWPKVRLSNIFKRVTRKNNQGNDIALTISGQFGLVRQEDFFKKRVAGEILSNYYLLKRDEYAFNRSSMKGYPFGAIKRLRECDSGVVSTLYICFALSCKECSHAFFDHFFESGAFNKEIYSIAQEGARTHGLLNLNVSDFFSLHVPLPCLEEQNRVAALLDDVDLEINLLKKYLLDLSKQKQGLMQKLLTGEWRVPVEEVAA